MDLQKEAMQREELRNMLFDLALSQNILSEPIKRSQIYKRFEDLYYSEITNQTFRHFYSDIFIVLTQIQENYKNGDINILGQNLSQIRKGYQAINYDKNGNLIDVSENIKKLYDHVSLDIARITYTMRADEELSKESKISSIDKARLNYTEKKRTLIVTCHLPKIIGR